MTGPSGSSRRLGVALVACLGLLLSSGCVRMPEHGPVVETKSEGDLTDDQPIFIDPEPPRTGDFPRDVVAGFLDAMTATPIDATVARQFLTEDARASWNPDQETITYSEASSPRGAAPRVSVTLTGADRLDGRGAWMGAVPREERVLQFPVARDEDGEWRIAEAPDALIVPESWFEQRYRQVSVYFFDPSAQVLVPEPVFVPRGEQLATTLTEALLQGPGADLAQVSRSFISPGLEIGVSVPVSSEGVADIALTGEAAQQTPQAVELMLAQFAWTLRQEPSIRALRVSVDGEPLQLPGGVTQVSVTSGGEYDPTGFDASSSLHGLQDGLLVSGPPDALEPVDGPLGAVDYGLSKVAVNLEATRAAGVSGGGGSVLRAPITGGRGGVREIVSGASRLLRPAWDFADRLWLVERTGSGARVSFVRGTRTTAVAVPGVTGRDVRGFLVSRDASRLVAVVRRPGAGDVVMVSRLQHDNRGRVLRATPARRIAWGDGGRLSIRDIAWSSPTTVAILSVEGNQLFSVRSVSVDGSPPGLDSLSTILSGRVRGLAGSPVPGQSLYAVAGANLVDLSSALRGDVALEPGATSLAYVG